MQAGPTRILPLFVLILACGTTPAAEPRVKTQNVLFVMTDGLRWQEVFGGADDALLNRGRGGVQSLERARRDFWRETAEERREALLPFTWTVIGKQGQLYGNRWKGSSCRVTNGLNISYPGYSEVLCGFVDPHIDSNEKRPNPNLNVLEWLNGREGLRGRVAAFTSWDVFPYVLNAERCAFPVNSGFQPLSGVAETPRVRLLNELMAETPYYGEQTRLDGLTFRVAREFLLAKRPRVLFVAFDQTDEQGHAGRYDRLLGAARRVDGFVKDLWDTVQEMPEYRGKTSLIFTVDHGRGDPPVEWKGHGKKTAGSDATWVAILGPDTPALGECKDVPEVTQTQIAATLATLLGQDYRAAVPRAGKPIARAFK